MTRYSVHTVTTAPAASRASLDALHRAFGVIPNIAGVMANSPVLIAGLVALFGQVHGGNFTEDQIQIVLLTDAVANASEWPVAFHSTLAAQAGIELSDIERIRRGQLPNDLRHAALSGLARAMIEKRGHLTDRDQEQFLNAGFSPENILEVVTIVAASTITNYTASIAKPPLEDAFRDKFWSAV